MEALMIQSFNVATDYIQVQSIQYKAQLLSNFIVIKNKIRKFFSIVKYKWWMVFG